MFAFLIKLVIGWVVINYLLDNFNPIFLLIMTGLVWLSIVTFKWEYNYLNEDGQGIGDESTTAEEYAKRIKDGIT